MNLLMFVSPRGTVYPVLEVPEPVKQAPENRPDRENGVKARVYKTYESLKSKLDYRERLCSELRKAPHLRVYHSARTDSHIAQQKLRKFLVSRYHKHKRWLRTDALLAALGIFLMPIPGPNIFFFYPAARTVGHYLARKGASHILNLESVSFHPEPLIDQIEDKLDGLESAQDLLAELERRYNVRDLMAILSRIRGK